MKYIILVYIFMLIGCGGGNDSGNNKQPPIAEQQTLVSLNHNNIVDFAQAIYYMEFLDIDASLSSQNSATKRVEDHLRSDGTGYVKYIFTNHKEYNSENIINGTVQVDILSIDQYRDRAKGKIKIDLVLTTQDNNISLYTDINYEESINTNMYSKMRVETLRIYDQRKNMHIDVKDFSYIQDKTGQEVVSGKLFVDTVSGYVKFKNTNQEYSLIDQSGKETKLTFSTDIQQKYVHVLYPDGTKQQLNVFHQYHVTQYEIPEFNDYSGYIEAVLVFPDKLVARYLLLNEDAENIDVNIVWYVNGKAVKTPMMYELPKSMYRKEDKITIKFTAINGDIEITKEVKLENNFYDSNENDYLSALDVINVQYQSNHFTFDFNILDKPYFQNIDLQKSKFSWSVDSGSGMKTLRVVEGTQYSKVPKLTVTQYGDFMNLYVMIYTQHEQKLVKIWLNLHANLFPLSEKYKFPVDNVITNFVDYAFYLDINNDQRKDVCIVFEQEDEKWMKLLVRQQDQNGKFDNYKIYKLFSFSESVYPASVVFSDLNGDGLMDLIFLEGEQKLHLFYQNATHAFVEGKTIHANADERLDSLYVTDLNDDNLMDIVLRVSQEDITQNTGLRVYYQVSGDSWKTVNIFQQKKEKRIVLYTLADFNADGLRDFAVTSDMTYTGYTTLKVYFQENGLFWKEQLLKDEILYDNIQGYPYKVSDIDNDGRDELLVDNEILHFQDNRLKLYQILDIPETINWKSSRKVQEGDFNGDGLKDFVVFQYKSDDSFTTLLNKKDIFETKEYSHLYDMLDFPLLLDLNKDGFDDLLILTDQIKNSSTVINVYFSKGLQGGFTHKSSVGNKQENFLSINTQKPFYGDFNGDGYEDIVADGYILYTGKEQVQIKPINKDFNTYISNMAIDDINHDGFDDLLFLMSNGELQVKYGGTL